MSTELSPEEKQLAETVLEAFDEVSGVHPGFRPTHAKGILLSGVFAPSPDGRAFTTAPHFQRDQTPVTVRLSDFGGIPAIPDSDPNASPRGIAIRFHLAEHVHTDLIAHSTDGFPARTVEEFVDFLKAAARSAGAAHPTPIELFLGTHPAALRFVQAPKPVPASFATESFFSVSAYKFTDATGARRHGRYRIRPVAGGKYLDAASAAAKSPDFLFDEIRERIARGPVSYRLMAQVADAGDVVDDATVSWPAGRRQVELGTIELTTETANGDTEQRHLIFDPIPRVTGIEPSADPLLDARATVYLASGRRRRSAPMTATTHV
jgi:catalase